MKLVAVPSTFSHDKFRLHFPRILLIIAIWLLMAIVVNPIGDFPLNDDWAYGYTVKTLIEQGTFDLSDWTAVNLFPQAIWGALFCLPFGFSFTALRLSMLTLGLIGVITSYILLNESGSTPQSSFLGALTVAVNPIYFGLSNTFMTDIFFFVLAILAITFLTGWLQTNSRIALATGVLFSLVSILHRQSGLILLPAFGCAYLAKKGIKIRTVLNAGVISLLGLIVHYTYFYWLQHTDRLPLLYNFQVTRLLGTFSSGFLNTLSTYGKNLLSVQLYLGLFLLPLVLKLPNGFLHGPEQSKRWRLTVIYGIALGLALMVAGIQIPLSGNVFGITGFGPRSIPGYSSALNSGASEFFKLARPIVTVLGVVGASLALQYLYISTKMISRDYKPVLILTALVSLFYFAPIGGLDDQSWFDRYILLLLFLVMIPIQATSEGNRKWTGVTVFLLVFYASFSVLAIHDYLLINRIRWKAAREIMAETRTLPEKIDGGFEFNGWYMGQKVNECNSKYQRASGPSGWWDFTCLWNGENYEYVISHVGRPGYEKMKEYSFRIWLPPQQMNVLVLRKKNSAAR